VSDLPLRGETFISLRPLSQNPAGSPYFILPAVLGFLRSFFVPKPRAASNEPNQLLDKLDLAGKTRNS
jgi:hypothetical protein